MTAPTPTVHPEFPTTSRLRFRQPVTSGGFVDAGWWPRSKDLTAELPALFEAVWTASREMSRVTYNLDTWDRAPRRMIIEGRQLHLGGYHQQNSLLLSMSDARHHDTIDLLVIPFDTDEATAERLLELASEPGNTNHPDQMVETALS